MRVSEEINEKFHAHYDDVVEQIAAMIYEDRLVDCECDRVDYANHMRDIIGVSFPEWDEMELEELWKALGRPLPDIVVRGGRPWQRYVQGINSRLESPNEVAVTLDRAYWAAERL